MAFCALVEKSSLSPWLEKRKRKVFLCCVIGGGDGGCVCVARRKGPLFVCRACMCEETVKKADRSKQQQKKRAVRHGVEISIIIELASTSVFFHQKK